MVQEEFNFPLKCRWCLRSFLSNAMLAVRGWLEGYHKKHAADGLLQQTNKAASPWRVTRNVVMSGHECYGICIDGLPKYIFAYTAVKHQSGWQWFSIFIFVLFHISIYIYIFLSSLLAPCRAGSRHHSTSPFLLGCGRFALPKLQGSNIFGELFCGLHMA